MMMHLFLKNFWGRLYPKWCDLVAEPSKWCIKGGKKLAFFIKRYLPVTSICIQLGELFGIGHSYRNIFDAW